VYGEKCEEKNSPMQRQINKDILKTIRNDIRTYNIQSTAAKDWPGRIFADLVIKTEE